MNAKAAPAPAIDFRAKELERLRTILGAVEIELAREDARRKYLFLYVESIRSRIASLSQGLPEKQWPLGGYDCGSLLNWNSLPLKRLKL